MIRWKFFAIVLCASINCVSICAQEPAKKEFLEYAHQSASRYIFNDMEAVILIHPKRILQGSLGTRLKPVFDGYVKSFLKHVTDQDVDPMELETMVVYLMPVSYTHSPSPRDRTRSRMPSSA